MEKPETQIEHLRFAPDILARLGEELSPHPDQGIVELVRNAYDADALTCRVEISGIDKLGGRVIIADDGVGMNDIGLRDGWLVLGRSSKSRERRTRLGRYQVGDKGLGRLAALRLGEIAKISTSPQDSPASEYSVRIDWAMYERAKTVEDIGLHIELSPNPSRKSHTTITVEELKYVLDTKAVKRLARSLVLLSDPFDNPSGFKATLTAPEFKQMEKLVSNAYFEDADFYLKGTIDEKGRGRATLYDWKRREIASADHKELTASEENYRGPASVFEFWAFILDGKKFSVRTAARTITELKEWLTFVGGVHLYHRGLRVYPYGDKGHDWLDLNLRRAQSPELRPSTNTSIGRISVVDSQDLLIQKTDRSGFIENEAFQELRRFATDSLEWMADFRLKQREAQRSREKTAAPRSVRRAKKSLDEIINRLPPRRKIQFKKLIEQYERARDRESKSLREEIQLYRTLSTIGTTFAVFAHEVESPSLRIRKMAESIERRGRKHLGADYENTLMPAVEQIVKSSDALSMFPKLALRLLEKEKRRSEHIPMHRIIDDVLEMFSPFLAEANIIPEKEFVDVKPEVWGSIAAVESIITNLITNTINAFTSKEATRGKRRVLIRTEVAKGRFVLSVMDNGPGIKGLSVEEIWLPGRTTIDGGTGLGLTIVKDAVSDMNGRVFAVAKGQLGGAEIVIDIPLAESTNGNLKEP